MAEDHLLELCNKFLDIEVEIDWINTRIGELKKDKEAKEEDLEKAGKVLREYMIEQGVPNMRFRGRLIYIHTQFWAKPKDKDNERAVTALKECGLDWLVQEKFDTRTVSSHLKEMAEQELTLPDTFYDAFEVKEFYSTRSKKG